MMKSFHRPSLVLSSFVVLGLTAGWAYAQLWAFREAVVPLTFVVPMLICLWTRRLWQLWLMAALFALFAIVKVYVILPADTLTLFGGVRYIGATTFNIVIGAVVVRAIMAMRAELEERNEQLMARNAGLATHAEELARQNEEIKRQGEKLARQNEAIETQSGELAARNDELQQTNDRLNRRESALQALLESVRGPETGFDALANICERALGIIGAPVESFAVLKLDGGHLSVSAQSAAGAAPKIPDRWSVADSIASVVLARDQTVYLHDLQKQPDLAAPFPGASGVRSVLATPLRIAGKPHGMVVACSSQAGHWTPEQFRMIEWVAAQCGLVAEALRWRSELSRRAREIEAANHAKDHFLAMLSHELRTPLTPVLAAAGVLEHDLRIPEDVRQDLSMIRRNIAIQSRLVDDLLDLTKLERGKLALQTQPLDFAALLHETALIVAPELDAKGQQLALDLLAAEGRQVDGDGPRLQQVFWNLLKNAIRFSPPQARIGLRTRLVAGTPPQIAVEVSDSGVGIDPANLGRIFRPFEQVASLGRNRSGDSGLGLGLSIAKAIVDLHGGTIAVASEGEGRGACFTVQLPLLDVGAGATSSLEPAGRPGDESIDLRALHILLVEDHADTGRVLARLLRRAGHTVDHCLSAGAAAGSFERNQYDVLISDLGLPDESGLELMKKLRVRRPGLPGICLSGYGMEEDLQACREAGFSEHLTKPVDMKRLHEAISRVTASLPPNS